MVKFNVDGVEYDAQEGENLLHAVLSQSVDLPYFCWHPAMGSIGACRQCAVVTYTDENDPRGRLQMACMTHVQDGMRISVDAAQATDFRSAVIEWLMENHPHDCPVCEEGGECHLQDMTVMTGHSMRRFKEPKRTWENQNLGPFIGHEMNRCITCYRCVRFYNDYAGGTDLAALGSRSRVYFGRLSDGPLENEFSGNLVEVCPTGVFTDKPFANHYTRKWDLQSAPSICPGCAVGCNTFVSERYGEFRRIHNRYNHEVNRYFICDRGRFGSHFINRKDRIKHAGMRSADGTFEYGNSEAVVQSAAELISDGAIGIGSPRASLEVNLALQELVGIENFCTGHADVDSDLVRAVINEYIAGGFSIPTIAEVEEADVVVIVGEDIANSAPRIALAVRQAARGVADELAAQANIPLWQDAGVRGHAQHAKNLIFNLTPSSSRLDDISRCSINSIAEILELVEAITHGLEADPVSDEASHIVAALKAAKNPLIISGSGLQSTTIIQAAASLARKLNTPDRHANLLLTVPEANSLGAELLGGELSMNAALNRMANSSPAIVVENDLYRRHSKDLVDRALANSRVILLDSLATEVAEKSSIVFPASTYFEQTGTYVNLETRAQRFYAAFHDGNQEIYPSWVWIHQISVAAHLDNATSRSFVELGQKLEERFPGYATIAPDSQYRLNDRFGIPRQTHRASGRTATVAHIDVHEPKTMEDLETPLRYSMEGENSGDQDPALIPYSWTPGWNSNQSVFKFQEEIAGPLKGGSMGTRLIDHQSTPLTKADRRTSNHSKCFPVTVLFGSDELSAKSWPVASRSASPFILINQEEANDLGIEEHSGIALTGVENAVFEVKFDHRIRSGTIGVSIGLQELPYISVSELTGAVRGVAGYTPRPDQAEKIIARDV